ncbi:MAG: hypothetical protein HY038_00555, partial [Nitrospirae bacterium]|nr:hypothetical protein [Nitrospirota bacterium]
MIRSMTGFGRRQSPWQDGSVTVEMRSVNHRFLEIACRLPRSLSHLEDSFKKAIQQRCARGRIDITVTVQGGKGRTGSVNLDQPLAKQYHQALRTLKKSLKLSGSIDLALMAGLRDVVSISDQPTEDPKLAKTVQQLTTMALTDLEDMRTREGKALAEDMRARIQTIRGHQTLIAGRSPLLAQEAFNRMKVRVEKLLGSEIPDPSRLYQELALYQYHWLQGQRCGNCRSCGSDEGRTGTDSRTGTKRRMNSVTATSSSASASGQPRSSMDRRGILFIISAPSGTGKTTLCKQ